MREHSESVHVCVCASAKLSSIVCSGWSVVVVAATAALTKSDYSPLEFIWHIIFDNSIYFY